MPFDWKSLGTKIVFKNIPPRAPKWNPPPPTPEELKVWDLKDKIRDFNLPLPQRLQDHFDKIARRKEVINVEHMTLHRMRARYMNQFNRLNLEERVEGWDAAEAQMIKVQGLVREKGKLDQANVAMYLACAEEIEAMVIEAKTVLDRVIKQEPIDDEWPTEQPDLMKEEPMDEEDSMAQSSSTQPSTSAPPAPVKSKRGRKKKIRVVDLVDKKYCSCQKETGEKMIFCENATCKFEWYHFSCAGVKYAPAGDWYCKDCRNTSQAPKRSKK